jgi:Zn finger protein HypA/HybF involved in hydrogenase expression
MGCTVKARCRDCNKVFTVEQGGGFSFHLVRCDKCGKTKPIRFDALGELHLRYLNGLLGPYSIETSEHDEHIRNHAPIETISEDDYHKRINTLAGRCRCRGKYTHEAPPRCPRCHSTRIEEGETIVMYD